MTVAHISSHQPDNLRNQPPQRRSYRRSPTHLWHCPPRLSRLTLALCWSMRPRSRTHRPHVTRPGHLPRCIGCPGPLPDHPLLIPKLQPQPHQPTLTPTTKCSTPAQNPTQSHVPTRQRVATSSVTHRPHVTSPRHLTRCIGGPGSLPVHPLLIVPELNHRTRQKVSKGKDKAKVLQQTGQLVEHMPGLILSQALQSWDRSCTHKSHDCHYNPTSDSRRLYRHDIQ